MSYDDLAWDEIANGIFNDKPSITDVSSLYLTFHSESRDDNKAANGLQQAKSL